MDYRNEFNKLLNRTIFSYPFYLKTDQELISDAKNRNGAGDEFGLFFLGEKSLKTVPIQGNFVDVQYLPLKSYTNDKESIHVKLSSFVYPAIFMSDFLSPGTKVHIQSKIGGEIFSSYNILYDVIEKNSGKMVLLTSNWAAITKLGNVTSCVNLIIIEDERKTADIIREQFKKERIEFINSLIDIPHRHFTSGPVDGNKSRSIFEEYKSTVINELEKIKKY